MPLYDYHCENCGSVSELLRTFHQINRNVLSAAVQNSTNWYPPILHYPEHRKLGCPGRAIRAAVARSRTRLTAKGPEVAAEKDVKNLKKIGFKTIDGVYL